MYTSFGGGVVFGFASTAAGVAALPNTGDNKFYIATSIFSIVVGVIILASTAVRFAVKRSTKA